MPSITKSHKIEYSVDEIKQILVDHATKASGLKHDVIFTLKNTYSSRDPYEDPTTLASATVILE
jgi:hypothetical protein